MNDLDPVQRSDQQLAADLAAGDASATAELARRYSSDLYDFSIRIVLDAVGAASVLEAALARAEGEAASRPAFLGLRAWMLGIVRDGSLDVLRQRGRPDAEPDQAPTPLSPADAMFVRTQDPSIYDLAQWAWQSSRSQRPRDYSLLDLSIRRKLSAEEIAELAGLSRTGIYGVLGRLRGSFEESFSAAALFYLGREACGDLDTLATLGRELRPALRRDIARHAEGCADCRATLSGLPLASDLFELILNVDLPDDLVRRIESLYPPSAAPQAQAPVPDGAGIAAAAGLAGAGAGIDELNAETIRLGTPEPAPEAEAVPEEEPEPEEAEPEVVEPMALVEPEPEVEAEPGEEPEAEGGEPEVVEPMALAELETEPEESLYEPEEEIYEAEPEAPIDENAPTLRVPRMPPPIEVPPIVAPEGPDLLSELYGEEEEIEPEYETAIQHGLEPVEELEAEPAEEPESTLSLLYDEEEQSTEGEEEAAEDKTARAVPLTFTRGRARTTQAPDMIRFERQDLYARPSQSPFARIAQTMGGGKGIWVIALLIGITLVSGYAGWAIGDSLQGGGNGNGVSSLPTRAGGARVLACGSGPVTVDQGSSVTLSLDPKALNGYELNSVSVQPVSPSASAQAVSARTQGANNVIFEALAAQGQPNRLDEYRLSVTLAKGSERVVSDCTVLVRAPATPLPTRPPAAATPGTPAAGTTPGTTGTARPAGTPAVGTATRVP